MLTFEKIRDVQRLEKKDKKLQKLPEDFRQELSEYLKRKKEIKEKTSSDILELENIKKTIKTFWEIREKKIVDAALTSAKSDFKPENLTEQEEEMWSALKEKISEHRKSFLSVIYPETKPTQTAKKEPNKTSSKKKAKEGPKKCEYLVKENVPEFVGPDLEEYELKKGDKTELPEVVAEILLKKGSIEKI